MDGQLNAAKEKINRLFSLINIKKVVHVDDEYIVTPEQIVRTLRNLPYEVLKQIPEFHEIDDISEQIEELTSIMETMEEDVPGSLVRIGEIITDGNLQLLDNSNPISELFDEYSFIKLSPKDWEDKKNELLEEGQKLRTLFLFDYSLGRGDEEGGMVIIRNVLASYADIICGLISNTFEPEEEYKKWQDFVSKYNVDGQRFALISKKHTNPEGRAQSVKLIALNEFEHDLIETAEGILGTAFSVAKTELKKLDIYDLEYMVFRSSYSEGVWEFDTLMRLMGIYQRRQLMQLAKTSNELLKTSKKLRDVAQIQLKPPKEPSSTVEMLRTWDLYDEDAYLNKYCIPLELGDIFLASIHSEDKETQKEYILLTQPCDLMVREQKTPGKRKLTEGVLAELSDNRPGDPMLFCEIEHYSEKKKYVDFRYAHIVNLSILDLCVFNQDGAAVINIGDQPPETLISPWQHRFGLLQNEFGNALDVYNKVLAVVTNPEHDEVAALELELHYIPSLSTTLHAKPALEGNRITYPIRRIKRLRQPSAGEILTRYAYSIARDAFEHDFTVIRNPDRQQ